MLPVDSLVAFNMSQMLTFCSTIFSVFHSDLKNFSYTYGFLVFVFLALSTPHILKIRSCSSHYILEDVTEHEIFKIQVKLCLTLRLSFHKMKISFLNLMLKILIFNFI